MIYLEDSLINNLSQRLNHISKVSSKINDHKTIMEYMETKLNRVILDWFLQNKQFIVAKTFGKEANI